MSLMVSNETEAFLARLRALGFAPLGEVHRKEAWCVSRRRGWWELSRPWQTGQDALCGGDPGLWKWVAAPEHGRQVFQWPEQVCAGELAADDRADVGGVLESMLTWAWNTVEGHRPVDWQAPLRAEVETWCTPEAYTIGVGHLLRQVELRCESELLALETPLVSAGSQGLPESRWLCLRRLALQTQSQWPMVRLRWDEPASVLTAEVNLTGAPAGLGQSLISAGLASLRGAVTGLAEVAELLADATVASEALTLCQAD